MFNGDIMDKKILELEKSLFKYEFMKDKNYLNNTIDDDYQEIGKSEKIFNKSDIINELSSLKSDRNIVIYNYSCKELSTDIWLVHYITKSSDNNYYRTSIWKKIGDDIKITFHQASLYNEVIDLIEN